MLLFGALSTINKRLLLVLIAVVTITLGTQATDPDSTVEAHQGPISGAITAGHGTPGFGLGGPITFCGSPGSNTRNWTWCYVDDGGVPLTRYYYTWNCGPTSQFGTTQCPSGNDYNWVTWQPSLPYSTDYRVCTYIPPAHAYTSGARYKIYYAGGVAQINFNQQPFSGWLDLGVYPFNAGTDGRLYLGDYTGEGWATAQIGVSATQFVVHGGGCGSGPLPSDVDVDEWPDGQDNCPTTYNPGQENNDGDAQGDACDPDDDNDSVADPSDNCQFVANPGQENNDADAQGDACDPDDDNDSIADISDNCQFAANTDQANNDGDTMGDVCDPDDDNDAVTDVADNCQFAANPGQENNDRNFVDNSPPYAPSTDDVTLAASDVQGDACDLDDDNDGLSDSVEAFGPCASTLFTTDPTKADSDGDRVVDGAECALGSDPANAASRPAAPAPGTDADGDGLSDAYEASIGSNPSLKDSDGDGMQDGWEVKGYNTNPMVVDSDGDGVKDGCEVASLNGDTVVNPGDQALLAAELMRAVPAAQKLANFDLNKDGAINPGDQAFQASKVGAGNCP